MTFRHPPKPLYPSPQPQTPGPAPPQQQGPSPGSWSTQSLSRSRGGTLAAKLPLRAVNSRISELLQGSAGSRSRGHPQGGGTDPGEDRAGGARFVRLARSCFHSRTGTHLARVTSTKEVQLPAAFVCTRNNSKSYQQI